MEKKILGRKKREFCIFLERILSVLLAVSLTFIFMNSFLTISTSYKTTYHYTMSPLEQDKAFEDSDLFHSLVRGNMEEITRYVVIRHQLETNGEYDTRKKIDITRYANRSDTLIGEQPTALFYLDDLVKWGNYGFTYNTVIGTWDELNRLFEGNEALYTQEGLAGVEEYQPGVSDNMVSPGLEAATSDQYAMEILVPRYHTVNGKDLMECASNVDEYEKLKENLVLSAQKLFADYTKYMEMQGQYGLGKTNIGYCFKIETENGPVYYTNSSVSFKGQTVDDITASIKGLGGKFLYYNPDRVQINTNMDFTAAQMRTILKEYEYSFGDNTRVWFWVDTAYPVQDDFYDVRDILSKSQPQFWSMAGIALICLVLIIFLMIYLTGKEGRYIYGDNELSWRLMKQDQIPLELWTIPVLAVICLLLQLVWELLSSYKAGTITYSWLPAAVGLIAFVINELAIRYYFSLVRRIKTRAVWKTMLIRTLGIKGKAFVLRTYDNGGVVTKTWIPYLIFLMVNLILVLLGIGGVLGALILDILIGIYVYRENRDRENIIEGIELIREGKVKHRIDTTHLHGENLRLANSVNSIGTGIRKAVETSMKDEKLKSDLITNVSHDIKTPLTSIITYVDLLKRENISDNKIASYLDILDNKSQRLKQLIDDLVEASKISSGNINIQMEAIDFVELVRQALGEFDEKFEDRQLQVVTRLPEKPAMIEADSSQLWRVLENLFQNISKYAMEGTRVYVEMEEYEEGKGKKILFSAKNISASFLEVQASELTERFIRGDQSRQTEGSGLGLSIAKNLIEAQDGEFEVRVDGDLFKVIVRFWELDNQ